MKSRITRLVLACCYFAVVFSVRAQTPYTSQQFGNFLSSINTCPSAVPFLLIAPDARAVALGECGVSTSADENSIHWNGAKLAFLPHRRTFSGSYSVSPGIHPGVNLGYASFCNRLNPKSTIGFSGEFFSPGKISFTDELGNPIGEFVPREFAFDACYARKLTENFSLALTTRFIYSNLTNGISVAGQDTKPGMTAAGDLSAFYQKLLLPGWSWRPFTAFAGMALSNAGSKLSYTNSALREFLPANLRLGAGIEMYPDELNAIGVHFEINKMLVPSAGSAYANASVISGIFHSFSDAPGGFHEELQEITYSTGVEYDYKRRFRIRTGYYYSSSAKNGRQSVSFGFGFIYKKLKLDCSYLIPTNGKGTALEKTFRVSLAYRVPIPIRKPEPIYEWR